MIRECIVDEDTLRDLASSACQEALSFGVNEDVFMRLARTVELRARAVAPQNDESQNVARIDLSKTPDGWRLVPIRPTKEMRAAAGREESKYNDSRQTFFAGDAWAPMMANAPEYVADEWEGKGHPPAGSVCEMTTNDGRNWRTVKIIFFDDYVTMIGQADGKVNRELFKRCDADVAFRPIRTPEQIAADEREAGINEIREVAGSLNAYPFDQLWDAGYRKP